MKASQAILGYPSIKFAFLCVCGNELEVEAGSWFTTWEQFCYQCHRPWGFTVKVTITAESSNGERVSSEEQVG